MKSRLMSFDPEYIDVDGWRLPLYRFGEGNRLAVVLAGVHGWEHAGVWSAYALIHYLASRPVQGLIAVLPVANPDAFEGESRLTRQDGGNLGSAYGGTPPTGLTGQLAQVIRRLTGQAELVLDLHAAGEARYLPHVIFWRLQDAQLAAVAGLPFAIHRTTTREGSQDTLGQALRPDQHCLTIEAGGGLVAWGQDVTMTLLAVRRLLAHQGWLDEPELSKLAPTAESRVFRTDRRRLLKAQTEGAFYPQVNLGEQVHAGQNLGWWLPLEDLQPRVFPAPQPGLVVYQRTRHRVHPQQTLTAIIELEA